MDVAEIMVRGVGGETAEEVLGGEALQVAGDRRAGFYRPAGAASGSSPHVVEVYDWGRLTSGPTTSVGWWVLLPFTLFNVTGWMLPGGRQVDGPDGRSWEPQTSDEPPRSRLWWARLAIVIGGGLLTALYVLWLAALLVGVVALGCHGDCVDRGPWNALRLSGGDPAWRLAMGSALLVVVWSVLLVYVERSHRLEWYEPDEGRRLSSLLAGSGRQVGSRLVRNTSLRDPAFWYRWTEYRRLWRWHLAASAVAIGAAVAVASDGAVRPDAAWGLPIGLAVAGFALASDPERRPDRDGLGPRHPAWALLWGTVHTGLGVVVAAAASRLDLAWFDRMESPAGRLMLLIRFLTMVLIVLGVALVVVQWGGGRAGRARRLAPGLIAAFAVAVAGAGLGSAYVLAGRWLMGRDQFHGLAADTTFPDVLAVSLLAVAAVWLVRVLMRPASLHDVAADYFPDRLDAAGAEPDGARRWLTGRSRVSGLQARFSAREWEWLVQVRRMRTYAEAGRQVPALLVWTTVVTIAVLGFEFVRDGGNLVALDPVPLFGIDALAAAHPLAAGAIVAFVFPGIYLMRIGLRGREQRRAFAKVWDVLGFWPRRFHPLAAPSYGERAVPEVRDRIKHHLSRGAGVVLSTHSQGTVIGYAALEAIACEQRPVARVVVEEQPDRTPVARVVATADGDSETSLTLDDLRLLAGSGIPDPARYEQATALGAARADDLGRVAVATYGSPLSRLYGPNFPAAFGVAGVFQGLRDRLCRLDGSPAWRNFYRPTDYIGKEVFIAPGGRLDPPDDSADVRLLESVDRRTGEPLPLLPPESHSRYLREPRLRAWLAKVRDGFAGRPEP